MQAEGVVYPEWDPDVHLVDWQEIPAEWPRIRAIDFGYTNPFVCLWAALDGDGRLWVYRQIYHTERTVARHSKDIKRLSQGERYKRGTVADHDAEDRATLAENGIRTSPARKAISVGLEKVRERLKVAGDGKPRLFVLRDCLAERDQSLGEAGKPWALDQEFDAYIWAEGRAKGDQPVKEHDHGMDALRYLIMQIDGGPSGPSVYEV